MKEFYKYNALSIESALIKIANEMHAANQIKMAEIIMNYKVHVNIKKTTKKED